MIAAALAACFMVQQARAAEASPSAAAAKATTVASKIVTLPRVVVNGHRMQPTQVVWLPRVEVTGKHIDSNETRQARNDKAAVLVAMR